MSCIQNKYPSKPDTHTRKHIIGRRFCQLFTLYEYPFTLFSDRKRIIHEHEEPIYRRTKSIIEKYLGTDPKKKNYEDSEHGPICGRGGSRISLKKNIYL